MKSFLFVLGVLGLCSGVMFAEEVLFDGRIQRAKFVSSFIKPGAIGAEIGVCEGVFAYHVLLPKKPSKLYLIDPWIYGLQADVEMDVTAENQNDRDFSYERVCKLFDPYSNVEVVRMKSEDAKTLFPNKYFDYVYIDGEHSYAAVTRDLNNYFSKLKVGGWLIGDDYGWTGIADAVQDFLKAKGDACFWWGNPYETTAGGQFAIRRVR
jgi:hypothetical protein